MKILGTGLSGLVGSRVVELLKDTHQFESISISEGIDITNRDQVLKKITSSHSSTLIHFAAKANVDECEKDRKLGEKGEAWKVNVIGTKNIIDACRESGKKIIHISTDYVFDGKKLEGAYSEEDIPNPINWYSRTKYEAELVVKNSGIPFLILRIALPYRSFFEKKKDFVRDFMERFQKGDNVAAIVDRTITPTFIDDIAKAIDFFLQREEMTGIFHVVGSQYLSHYDAAFHIARIFGFDTSHIIKTTNTEFFKGKAPRPFRLALKNDKIQKLGITMKTFEEGLKAIKLQMGT